jgi:tetratricopeptide (TPR) repeat protein
MDPTAPAEEKKLFSSCSSTRQFLFSKTDPFEPETRPWDIPFEGSDTLVEIFPNMLSGPAFIEHALSVIKDASAFGVVVVRLDHGHGEDAADTAEVDPNRIIETGKIIAQTSGEYNSIWGQLGHDTWGCFLPDADEAACTQWCSSLKADLAKQTLPGVTVGIAVYPCSDFTRPQMIENAWKALHHATFFGPDAAAVFDAVSLNISGDRYYQKGDIPGAVREFKAALALDPSNVNVHNSLGVCYSVLGEFKSALAEFETALALEPSEFMAVYNIGLTHQLMENPEPALEFFLKAGDLKSDIYEINLNTGHLLLQNGSAEKAMAFLEKSVELKPDSGLAFRYLADCLQTLGRIKEAIRAYKKAVKLYPYDADSISALGWLFAESGENLEIATMFCRQATELAPDRGLFFYRLGRLYLKTNRVEEALAALENAQRLGHDAKEFIETIQGQQMEEAS